MTGGRRGNWPATFSLFVLLFTVFLCFGFSAWLKTPRGQVSRCRGCCTRRCPSWRTARTRTRRVWWGGSRRLRRLWEESWRTTASPGTSSSGNAVGKKQQQHKITSHFQASENTGWRENLWSVVLMCVNKTVFKCLASKWFRRSATIRSSLFPNSFLGGNSRAASWNRDRRQKFVRKSPQQRLVPAKVSTG